MFPASGIAKGFEGEYMKFIAVERTAAAEIISDRTLQSTDFEAGRTLGNVLVLQISEALVSPRLKIMSHQDGLFFLSRTEESSDFVIFDLETSQLFAQGTPLSKAVLYFQRVLRFAIKVWSNLRVTLHERILSNSRAVLFPFPMSQFHGFRIVFDLAPGSKRQAKRPAEGRSILVYKSGFDEGGGPSEEVSLTNFRNFLDARKTISTNKNSKASSAEKSGIQSLKITSLDEHKPEHDSGLFQGYERWMTLLTDQQKDFVSTPLHAPHRIEGPAGTGKTISLILKAITALHESEEQSKPYKALLVTHSEATRRTIEQVIEANDPWAYLHKDPIMNLQTLKLATLQQLCGELLNREISESEFLDRDALESKQYQVLLVSEALSAAMKEDYPTHKKFLSSEFDEFLAATEDWVLPEMFQHEISVVIKGRADEQLDSYRKLPVLKYGLPAQTAGDRGFVWRVFQKYQAQLQTSGQFDTDDIILTTIGQLDTPLWRRRRDREGYDGIFVDETHLFNINELSLFHHLTRSNTQSSIAYSVDRSQAIGDRGWTNESFDEALSPDPVTRDESSRTEVRSIFRCSPDIVDLAFSVTSSGATLFTNFDDPMKLASSLLTGEEERKCSPPLLITCPGDDQMIANAFKRADRLADEMETARSNIALVAFSSDLFAKATAYAETHNKPLELLKQRGDIETIHRAEKSGRFVLSMPEYVGGLEFDGVILIGVDDGRVPPIKTDQSAGSRNFLAFSSHNRLYVAITRARYRLEILATKERGPSPLLKPGLHDGILKKESC
jgi:hypothetical protein